jgi:diguanylate cyclase (GGDEF)-like protein
VSAGLPAKNLAIAAGTGSFKDEGWRLRKDGGAFWASVVIDAIRGDDGERLGFTKITRDITERRQHELSLLQAKEAAEQYSQRMASFSRFLDSVISNMPASVLVQDRSSGHILLANQQAQRLFGGSESRMKGCAPRDCLSADVAAYIDRQAAGLLTDAETRNHESLVNTAIGPRTVRTRTVLGSRPDNEGDYLMIITEDVTAELAAYAQIHHMAQHDGLTNLPNRVFFNEHLEKSIREGEAGAGLTALLCLDLDNFKNVNDALGHAFGDKILLALTKRLRKCLRDQDMLARLGGDEFAVVLRGLRRPDEARDAAQRLIDAVTPAFLIDGHSFAVGLSIGIAFAAPSGSSGEQLLRFGDMALYEAKHNGRNRYELFRPELEEASRTRRQLEIELRSALDLGQLEMYYQPIIDNSPRRIAGYEALMRWQHPTRGLVAPMCFIPLAEETGLIHELGTRALELACREAASWNNDASVAVNLSPVQFKNSELVNVVARVLADSGLAPARLELEITESVLFDSTQANLRTLEALKRLGVAISLDDFATGASSLGYLRAFPFDRIKIDRSFVRDMGESREALAIIRAITGLGSSLAVKITAEGVETEEQYLQLQKEGCSHFQGFLFGHPQPPHQRIKRG